MDSPEETRTQGNKQLVSVRRRNEISIIVLLAACLVLHILTGKPTTISMMESSMSSRKQTVEAEHASNRSSVIATSKSLSPVAETTTTSTTSPVSSKDNDDLKNDTSRHCELRLPSHVASALFHPKSFFENGGPGNPWLEMFQKNVQNDFKAVEYAAFQFVNKPAPLRQDNNNECQSVHLHLHKCGGTTTSSALKNAKMLGSSSDRFKFTNQHHNHLRRIYEHQINASLPTIPVFTFIRDPVSRFFSGLNQFRTLSFRFPSTHPITVALREENETIPMLERVISTIHNQSSFLNVHLLPQAFEMYKMANVPRQDNKNSTHDIAIQIFDLRDMNAVLETVGVPRDLIQVRNTAKKRDEKNRKKRRRPLHKHNIDISILTPELKRKICELYAMDVKMIRETGIAETSCD